MNILIIFGPNLNLIGLWGSEKNKTVTLDKLNRHIKKLVRNKDVKLKILQTHSETKAVSYIQNNRKKIDAIILVPGPWQYSVYSLADLLELIGVPFITIAFKIKDYIKLLNGFENLIDDDLTRAFENAINMIGKKLNV